MTIHQELTALTQEDQKMGQRVNKGAFIEIIALLSEASSALEKAGKLINDEDSFNPNEFDMIAKCVVYHFLKESNTTVEALRKKINGRVDFMNKTVLPSSFDNAGTDKIQVAALGRSFYPVKKASATIKDKEAGYQWLRDNGGEELITETVNASSLSAFIAEYMAETAMEPDEDVIAFREYQIIGSSKYRPKK